jgi:hypothetical protein
MNVKGNDWVASIVSALIVGVLVAGTNYLLAKDKDDSATLVAVQGELVALKTKFEYLAASVNTLTGQPYVRQTDFSAGIDTVQGRISGLEKRVDGFERRIERIEIKRGNP